MSNFLQADPPDRLVQFAALTLVAASGVALAALACARCARRNPAVGHCILLSGLIWVLLTPLVAIGIGHFGIPVFPRTLSFAVRTAWLKTIAWTASQPTADVPRRTLSSPLDRQLTSATDVPPARHAESPISPTFVEPRAPAGRTGDQPLEPALRGRWESSTVATSVLRTASGVVLSVWLAGSILLLIRIFVSQVRLRAVRRRLLPVPIPCSTAMLDEVQRALNLKALPPMRMSDRLPMPCVVGIFRATVVLTRESIELLDAAQLRDVLVHECAHVLRRDCLNVLLQKIAAAAFWPSPFVHLLNRRLAVVREEVCDNYVLTIRDRVSYGDTLFRFATLAGNHRAAPAVVGMLHRKGQLESRVAGLIDKKRSLATRANPKLALLMACAMGMVCVAVCGGPIAADQAPAGEPRAPSISDAELKAIGSRERDPIVIAKAPTHGRLLVMPGLVSFARSSLLPIRAPFITPPHALARVIEIGHVPEAASEDGRQQSISRELRSGDRVSKGDLLAVFDSDAVRNKENDLRDATSQLNIDREILKRAEQKKSVLPDVMLLRYRRAVVDDKNAMERALSSLRAWGIPEKDILAVMNEAEKVAPHGATQQGGRRDVTKDNVRLHVAIRSPVDGIVIERNLALHEVVGDNTINLFQIASVDPAGGGLKLNVMANCPVDDLAAVDALPTNLRRWTISTEHGPDLTGTIDDVTFFVDPNQHTAVVNGHVDNTQGKLRSGQFVRATVQLPAPPNVVELPQSAVWCCDDPRQCVVFVQTDPRAPDYRMRRVEVVRQFDHSVYIRSKPFDKSQEHTSEDADQGLLRKEPLRPGERVLGSGVAGWKALLRKKEGQQPPDRFVPRPR